MISTRNREQGFSLTELMVTVVIIGILAAVAAPSLSRDKAADLGGNFADDMVRDLQKARVEAVSNRLPIRAYFYSDRIEFRSFTPQPPQSVLPPTPPTATTPVLRVLRAPQGVVIWDAREGTSAPTSQVLSPTQDHQIDFLTTGGALFNLPASTGAATSLVYTDNQNVPAIHPLRYHRVLISNFTGFIREKQQ